MYDLFRFITLRPAVPVHPDDSIPLDAQTDLQNRLREAGTSDHPGTAVRQVANEYMNSESFVADPARLESGAALSLLDAALDQHPPESLEALNELIDASFNQGSSSDSSGSVLASDRLRLGDSLLAVKAGDPHPGVDVPALQRSLRLIVLTQRALRGDSRLNEPGVIAVARQAPILLPDGIFKTKTAPGGTQDAPTPASASPETLAEYNEMIELYDQLMSVQPDDLNETVEVVSPEEPAPDVIDNNAIWSALRDLQVSVERATLPGVNNLTSSSLLSAAISPLTLKTSFMERFTPGANNALNRVSLDLTRTPVPVALEKVNRKLSGLYAQVGSVAMARSNVAVVGGKLLLKDDLPDMQVMGAPGQALPPELPKTHGTVKPVGVGDLLVVKQQIIGYEPGEVAYIENILKGEIHSRSVRRAETVEESILTERENISEEERDLQSTERFEMRRESEQVASMDGKLRSPAYGGLLEFESSAESPVHGSQQMAERQASTYGKEVTSRAVSKITERVRTQVMRRTVREFEEKTAHEYNNVMGEGHVTGVYQWVDKVYQAQVYNYGKRLLYDIIVPEPGAFLIQALARAQSEGRELIKPEPFTLQPEQITDYNYGYYAAKYEVTGLEAPPAYYQVVSDVIEVPDGPQLSVKKLMIPVPAGYEAVSGATFQTNHQKLAQGEYLIELTVGQRWYRRTSNKNPLNFSFNLSGEVNSVPVALKCWQAWLFTVAISITCRRSEATYRRWQLRAHDVIRQAYQRQKAEYEERLANVEAALRVGALGQNSEQKRALVMDELKKSCISIFTYQFFDVFNAIDLVKQVDPVTGKPVPYAQVRLPDAEIQGKYIRFFEQAFEWEQVMHHLYSYFWGRKDHWMNKVMREDRDAEFNDFLKAGAARVVVPVRPGFEPAILHFMETGEIWEGGDVPEINSPQYVPLLDEIKARDNAQGAEMPYGPPWKLRLPTSLVKLRADGSLPTWREENGEWIAE